MPKVKPNYPVQLSFKVSEKTRGQLIDLSKVTGFKYGTLLRKIVEEYLDEKDIQR